MRLQNDGSRNITEGKGEDPRTVTAKAVPKKGKRCLKPIRMSQPGGGALKMQAFTLTLLSFIGLKKIKKPVYEAVYWGTVWWGGGGVSGDL